MSGKCSVCTHPERDAIESLIVRGVGYRDIVGRYNVTRSAISRHVLNGHMRAATAEAQQSRIARLQDEIDQLTARIRAMLDEARTVKDKCAVVREYRSLLEVQLRLEGAYEQRSTEIIIKNPRRYEEVDESP